MSKPKKPSLTTQQILNLDNEAFNKMSAADLRKAVSKLASMGNTRLKAFERTGESSPASRYIEQSGGRFSAKGKDLNALRAEYARAHNFLESSTGSVTKWRGVKRATIQSLKKEGIKVSQSQFDDLWKSYEKLKELSPEVSNRRLKYQVLQEISEALKDGKRTPEEIANEMHRRISEIYEERAEQESPSDFFELEPGDIKDELKREVRTLAKNASIKQGYKNTKRELKRALRELSDMIDLDDD